VPWTNVQCQDPITNGEVWVLAVVGAWFRGVTGMKEGGVGELDKSHPSIGCPGSKLEGGLKEEVSLEQEVNDEG